MSEPFLGEVKMMSFNFAPKGWAACNGALLPINQNQALFSLLGTQFGGNGQTTFALPDLRGRTPIHFGGGYNIGQQGGEMSHTLTASEMPAHTHTLSGSADTADRPVPTDALPAVVEGSSQIGNVYSTNSPNVSMAAESLSQSGGDQPHQNMQPYRVISFCIALQGIFPSRN
jgi:microcystin-dependent protein